MLTPLKKLFKKAKESILDGALIERKKYDEKTLGFMGKKIGISQSGRYDYSKNNNWITKNSELKEIQEKIKLNNMGILIKELCRKLFSETYLYVEVHTYIKTLIESIRNIKPNLHLIRFKDTYEEMIYGRRRSKAEAA